jgi:putative hydrolase of the HAD superfamily
MSIKTVIFDLGGVLVRKEEDEPRAALGLRVDKTPAELEKIVFGQTSIQASLGKITAREHWQAVMRALNLPDSEIDNTYAQFFGGDKVDYAFADYIRSLRPRYSTALLSNAWDDLRHLLSEVWQIDDAFDEIFISAELKIAKPQAAIYQLALKKLGVSPQEAVFIDDMKKNVIAARELGMHAILFKNKAETLRKLEELL